MQTAVLTIVYREHRCEVPYSLFPVPYSLFPIPCSLFPVPFAIAVLNTQLKTAVIKLDSQPLINLVQMLKMVLGIKTFLYF